MSEVSDVCARIHRGAAGVHPHDVIEGANGSSLRVSVLNN